jgi:hypothetical protein
MSNSLVSQRSQQYNEDHPMTVLKRELMARKQQRDQIEQLMETFTKKLFDAFESVVNQAIAYGVPGLGKTRRLPHPAGDWRQALQIFIEDWSVIMVPLVGYAWPNPRDDAKISSNKFKEQCGRIALFIGDEPTSESIYDYLIFADGSWFAWGYGWPRTEDDIENTNFEMMAYEMLVSFAKDIHTTWRPRRITTNLNVGTMLSQSLDAKKRAYNFGLPGDE